VFRSGAEKRIEASGETHRGKQRNAPRQAEKHTWASGEHFDAIIIYSKVI